MSAATVHCGESSEHGTIHTNLGCGARPTNLVPWYYTEELASLQRSLLFAVCSLIRLKLKTGAVSQLVTATTEDAR